MNPKEFFKEYGLVVEKFDEGLLAFPDEDAIISGENWSAIYAIPKYKGEYQGALMTCFCNTEEQLMAAVTTAAEVSFYLRSKHRAAGCM